MRKNESDVGQLYFNTAAIGRSSSGTAAAMREFADLIASIGPRSLAVTRFVETGAADAHISVPELLASWRGLRDTAAALRRLAAVSQETAVVFTQGTASALQLLLQACDGSARIGLTDVEHESEKVVARNVAGSQVDVIRLRRLFDRSDARQRLIEAVVTAAHHFDVVVLSHVTATDGIVLPIAEIIQGIRELSPDVRVIVDGAHGLGQIAVDLSRGVPDAYVGSGHKWLGGPPTSGFALLPPNSGIAATQRLRDHLVSGILLDDADSSEPLFWGPATIDVGALVGLGLELMIISDDDRRRKTTVAVEKRDQFEQFLRGMTPHASVDPQSSLPRGSVSLVKFARRRTTLSREIARELEDRFRVIAEGAAEGAVRFSFCGVESESCIERAARAVATVASA